MEKKMASKLAVICYGFGDLASQFVWTFVGSYLTIYYTDIVGLAPAIVSVIMMGARIWDAINDPMMGAIAERTRSKFGRFRPYIAFGCPFLAIFAVLTFTNPFGGGSAAGAIWAAVTYIIAGMLYTLVNIPYAALSGVMTEDANQRNKINTSRNIGMNLGMVIVNALSAGLALRFSGEGAEVANGHGYMMTALIYAIISIPLFLIVFATAKEKVQPMHGTQAFSFKEYGQQSWGVFPDKSKQGGGPLIDIGTHALDITLWCMDNYKPATVTGSVFEKLGHLPEATEGNMFGPWDPETYEVEDSAFGYIKMENGATIFLESSWALNVKDSREAATTLCGTKAGAEMIGGMSQQGYDLVFNETTGGVLTEEHISDTGAIAFFEGNSGGSPEVKECKQWLEAILLEKEPLVKPEQAFVVTQILDTIYKSAAAGKEIKLG